MSNLRDLLICSRTGSDGDLFAFLHSFVKISCFIDV